MNVKIEANHIYNMDCLILMASIPDNHIDLVVTSPPYDDMRSYDGNSTLDLPQIASQLYRIVKWGGVVVWVIADQSHDGNESGTSFRHALLFKDVGFNLFDTMIYAKPPRGAVGDSRGYWQAFEYMFVFSKGAPKTINLLCDRMNKECRNGDKGSKRLHNGSLKSVRRNGYKEHGRRTNIWEYQVGAGHSSSDNLAKSHPAIFPEGLARDHILSWSNEGDLVYDPFCGSGTTSKMCVTYKRNFIASDVVAKYCDIAKERVALAQNEVRARLW